jgi:hypothetical protein
MSFCLYISARVFVQYLKSRPDDSTVYSSLQFVVSALNAMKSKNPLTESFLVQLDVDLEGTGIRAVDNAKAGSGASNIIKAMVSPFTLTVMRFLRGFGKSLWLTLFSNPIALTTSSALLYTIFASHKVVAPQMNPRRIIRIRELLLDLFYLARPLLSPVGIEIHPIWNPNEGHWVVNRSSSSPTCDLRTELLSSLAREWSMEIWTFHPTLALAKGTLLQITLHHPL